MRSSFSALLTLVLFPLLTACGAASGETCRLQSDCGSGLMCFDGLCQTSGLVADALSYHDTGSKAPEPSGDTDDPAGEVAVIAPTHPCGDQPYTKTLFTCAAARSIFEPSTNACEEPSGKYAVRSVTMAAEGGFVKMADVANPVLADGLNEDRISIELWRDGDFSTNCSGGSAWMLDPVADRNANCTPKYGDDVFPLDIPIGEGLLIVVRDIEFDLLTGKLTGLVNREKLINDLPEALRAVGGGLIEANVDTDGDGTPEDAAVTLTVCFE